MEKKLPLDEKLGFSTKDSFYLRLLYGATTDFSMERIQYGGEYRMGDILDVILPPYGALVLEITEEPCKQTDVIPTFSHAVDVFFDDRGNRFSYPIHEAADRITLTSCVVFTKELENVLHRPCSEREAELENRIPAWYSAGMPFTFTSSLTHRLILYIPFDGPVQPTDVALTINGQSVPIVSFRLANTIVARYAFIESYVRFGARNTITLDITGLAADSFLGAYVDYPDLCEGIHAESIVFPERAEQSPLHTDPTLVIDRLAVTPQVLSDLDEPFTVTAWTRADPAKIEGIYFLHPSKAQMPAMTYQPQKDCWEAVSRTGTRALNIFCNTKITARIRGIDGGVGPAAEIPVEIRYDAREKR